MVSLAELKKKLWEYFTFPDGTEKEHIVISHVLDIFLPIKRKILTSRIEKTKPGMNEVSKNFDQIKSDSQVEPVEPVERKTIHLSTNEDLMSIVWTASHKIDLAIIVDTSQQLFSSYTFPKMKVLFGLKADSYVELPRFTGGISEINEALRDDVIKNILEIHMASLSIVGINKATRCEFISRIIYKVASMFGGTVKVYPQYEFFSIDLSFFSNPIINLTYLCIFRGPGPIDWAIKVNDTIIFVTEAKRENIDQGVDWIITKIVLSNENDNENGDVQVYWSSKSPVALPINKRSLTHHNLVQPISDLLEQIKWIYDLQIESQKWQRTD
ncbi:crinkler family protein [Gigaspora margarita]|uniref:Crinkler family protein n=1 Tax=Gigaspora margarita TaxID=4874 RepID=A0A8H3X6P2_GIGMA|nr:crinkler family protein [Gigaspora margarita]